MSPPWLTLMAVPTVAAGLLATGDTPRGGSKALPIPRVNACASLAMCSCEPVRTPIRASAMAEVVFVGRVVAEYGPVQTPTSIRMLQDGSFAGSGSGLTVRDSVRLQVAETWQGAPPAYVTIDVTSGCQGAMRTGERWLVYGWREDGAWRTTTCRGTRPVRDADADRAFFARRSRGLPVGALHGMVLVERPFAERERLAKAGVSVVASGPAGRFSAPVRAWGEYVLVLPPGRYAVRVEQRGRRVGAADTIAVGDGQEQRWPP